MILDRGRNFDPIVTKLGTHEGLIKVLIKFVDELYRANRSLSYIEPIGVAGLFSKDNILILIRGSNMYPIIKFGTHIYFLYFLYYNKCPKFVYSINIYIMSCKLDLCRNEQKV